MRESNTIPTITPITGRLSIVSPTTVSEMIEEFDSGPRPSLASGHQYTQMQMRGHTAQPRICVADNQSKMYSPSQSSELGCCKSTNLSELMSTATPQIDQKNDQAAQTDKKRACKRRRHHPQCQSLSLPSVSESLSGKQDVDRPAERWKNQR